MSIDYAEIGRQIRKYRKARGMTQSELAEAIEISPTHMSHIETAGTKLSLPVLVDLAHALEVPSSHLITESSAYEKESLLAEAQDILASCPEDEARIMLDVLKTMRSSFRRHGGSFAARS